MEASMTAVASEKTVRDAYDSFLKLHLVGLSTGLRMATRIDALAMVGRTYGLDAERVLRKTLAHEFALRFTKASVPTATSTLHI